MATGEEGEGTPVVIKLGAKVVGLDAEGGILTLADGERVTEDLVVVADGTHSSFLREVVGREVPMIRTGRSAYRRLVSMEKAMTIPKIREVFEGELPGFFILVNGSGGAFTQSVTYPCRSGTMLNWAVIHSTKERYQGKDGANWNHPATVDDVLECLENFHPAWKELCKQVEEVKYFTVMFHEPLERICRGKAVLIGDSAHPMLPTHGQGAAMVFEEAGALEIIFGPGTRSEDVEKRLEMFQSLRLPRRMIAQVLSNMWDVPRENMMKEIAKIDPCATIPPEGSRHFGKEVRAHFFPYDCARRGLEGFKSRWRLSKNRRFRATSRSN